MFLVSDINRNRQKMLDGIVYSAKPFKSNQLLPSKTFEGGKIGPKTRRQEGGIAPEDLEACLLPHKVVKMAYSDINFYYEKYRI